MLNKEEYLLTCLGEETGELAQAVGKVQRFGANDAETIEHPTNIEKLITEFHDIVAVYEMLCNELNICSGISPVLITAKKIKLEKYMEYSRKVGKLCVDTI